jgi:lipopolysaccharide/colanic/teichoic acid biosynthesis glycosyltransferase
VSSDQGRDYRGKRVLDVVVLVLVAIPASVLALVSAVAVRLSSKGPVLFRQPRVGRDGRTFELLKFRTMRHGRSDDTPFPEETDITRVGRVLRRLALDELPQLWNVARGEMSAVGPRPTLEYQVERYTPAQRGRLAVRPGLTGLAQVKGRNDLDWPSRIEFDLEYVRRQSLGLDLSILARTVPALLLGRGVSGHPRDDPIASP